MDDSYLTEKRRDKKANSSIWGDCTGLLFFTFFWPSEMVQNCLEWCKKWSFWDHFHHNWRVKKMSKIIDMYGPSYTTANYTRVTKDGTDSRTLCVQCIKRLTVNFLIILSSKDFSLSGEKETRIVIPFQLQYTYQTRKLPSTGWILNNMSALWCQSRNNWSILRDTPSSVRPWNVK